MNWADCFWNYDVPAIERALDVSETAVQHVCDGSGSSLMELALKYADPEAPEPTIEMVTMLARRGWRWQHESHTNLLVFACERELGVRVVGTLLTLFYQQRGQFAIGATADRSELPRWMSIDHDTLVWACERFRGSEARYMLRTVEHRPWLAPELAMRVLKAAVASKDESWAVEVASDAHVQAALRSIEIPSVHLTKRNRQSAPKSVRELVKCIDSAIHHGMERLLAQLDQANHRVVTIATAFHVSVMIREMAAKRRPSWRKLGPIVLSLATQFGRDVAWDRIGALVMEHRRHHRRSNASGTSKPAPHPLNALPDSVFKLILSFILPSSELARAEIVEFARWINWRPTARFRQMSAKPDLS